MWEQGYHIHEIWYQISHIRASQNGSQTRLTRLRSILRGTRVEYLILDFIHMVSYKSPLMKSGEQKIASKLKYSINLDG